MIKCDTCPRCKDIYPDKLDWAGNHFCICGLTGNMVYTMPRKERRLSGHGWMHFGISSCGLYDSFEDAWAAMIEPERRRWREFRDDQ